MEADLARGDAVVSFDPRGLGETRMRYKAVSIDDPALAALDEDAAYASPLSGVLANYAYNALLTGRPYLLDMIEDAELAVRFSRDTLGAQKVAVAECRRSAHPGRRHRRRAPRSRAGGARRRAEPASPGRRRWRTMRETWPVPYLIPGGAGLRLER